MSPDQKIHPVFALLGVLWAGSVTLFYLLTNADYYKEKISLFAGFFIKLAGLD